MVETQCAFDECDKVFTPWRHGQKYCSAECTKKANNKRAVARYHKRRQDIAEGVKRICKIPGCRTVLRKGSDEDICDPCLNRDHYQRKVDIRRRILGTD